jgi:hypothetical protein
MLIVVVVTVMLVLVAVLVTAWRKGSAKINAKFPRGLGAVKLELKFTDGPPQGPSCPTDLHKEP